MFNYTQLDPTKVTFVEVAPVDQLKTGKRMFIEAGDRQIVLFNVAGKIFAISDVCTHDDGPLGDGKLESHEIICPRHGARFDLRTGKVLQLPAVVDIPAYPVRVREGKIEIGIPRE